MPHPAPGEVLVRVVAAGVNFADLSRARGTFLDGPAPPDQLWPQVVLGLGGAHRPQHGQPVRARPEVPGRLQNQVGIPLPAVPEGSLPDPNHDWPTFGRRG